MLYSRMRFSRKMRQHEFIVTAPIQFDDVTLMPGDDYPAAKVSYLRLKRLYKNRKIGVKNSDWANQMIKRYRTKSSSNTQKLVVKNEAAPSANKKPKVKSKKSAVS